MRRHGNYRKRVFGETQARPLLDGEPSASGQGDDAPAPAPEVPTLLHGEVEFEPVAVEDDLIDPLNSEPLA